MTWLDCAPIYSADLRDAIFTNARVENVDFDGARVDWARFINVDLSKAVNFPPDDNPYYH